LAKSFWPGGLALAVLVAGVFWPMLGFDFVRWDDDISRVPAFNSLMSQRSYLFLVAASSPFTMPGFLRIERARCCVRTGPDVASSPAVHSIADILAFSDR